jgi:hypothetical protein
MKNVKLFKEFQEMNEISKELIDRASIEMINRGQHTRS